MVLGFPVWGLGFKGCGASPKVQAEGMSQMRVWGFGFGVQAKMPGWPHGFIWVRLGWLAGIQVLGFWGRAVGGLGIQQYLSFHEGLRFWVEGCWPSCDQSFSMALSWFVRFASAREINAKYCKQMEVRCDVYERLLQRRSLQSSLQSPARP